MQAQSYAARYSGTEIALLCFVGPEQLLKSPWGKGIYVPLPQVEYCSSQWVSSELHPLLAGRRYRIWWLLLSPVGVRVPYDT